MKAGADKGENMEQLMKSEGLREVWPFQNEDHCADGIGDSSRCNQEKTGDGNGGEGLILQEDGPAHD